MARSGTPDLAAVAGALADHSRAAMVLALMDGRAWTVGELAIAAGVARSTASEHVDRLGRAGLLRDYRQGRHRYVALRDEGVAQVVESLAELADTVPPPNSYRAQRVDAELAAARSCYRHLAGDLGVTIAQEWMRLGVITGDWTLSATGQEWFPALGVAVPDGNSPPLLRPCLDWTARRPHAAGPLADAFLTHALNEGWLERGRHPRALRLTATGQACLVEAGVNALRAP